MRKTPLKKRVTRSLRPRSNVDPTRVALAALDRIKTVLLKSGYKDRIGEPLAMKELAAQAQFLGTELPPSYVAAMRVASTIGEPEVFLHSDEMEGEAERIVMVAGEEARRYAPFCKGLDYVVCFDKEAGHLGGSRYPGELPVIECRDGTASPLAAHFGEWLDSIADRREESVETAAKIPQRLKRLLYELGFRFEYPVVGRLETGDVGAIVELIGEDLARHVRADVDRLFDSSGKASVTLNVDEFTLAVSLRNGIYVFEAEDVFRWLRTFRDENFFSDVVTVPSHPDDVRDLRRAPREPPLIRRGVLELNCLPARKVNIRSACGIGSNDFYLLGRTASTSDRAPSVVLHVENGKVAGKQSIDEPLNDLHVLRDGTIWGLTTTHCVRIEEGKIQTFPLRRPSNGRPWWYGIGGSGDRVLVWGAGALLEFDGKQFVPFEPDAMLDEDEAVVALSAHGLQLWMLVCGDHVGAVARFDAIQWEPISEDHVIDGTLIDLDVWRGRAHVLDRDGGVWRIQEGPPYPVDLLSRHQAYLTEAGTLRPLYGMRSFDGGFLLASHGGVIVGGEGGPLFHAVPNGREPFRLIRVGERSATSQGERDHGIIAISGPDVWILQGQRFTPVDLREW